MIPFVCKYFHLFSFFSKFLVNAFWPQTMSFLSSVFVFVLRFQKKKEQNECSF